MRQLEVTQILGPTRTQLHFQPVNSTVVVHPQIGGESQEIALNSLIEYTRTNLILDSSHDALLARNVAVENLSTHHKVGFEAESIG